MAQTSEIECANAKTSLLFSCAKRPSGEIATRELMGFHLQTSHQGKTHPTAKSRVWGFFCEDQEMSRGNRPQPEQPRRKNRLAPTKLASGVLYW